MLFPLVVLALLPADMNELFAEEATASSYLKSNWNKFSENYHPSYVLDDDPKTAWVEGKDGDGIGESLTIPVSSLKSARSARLRIRNGYQKSKKLFHANAAPKDVEVRLLSSAGVTVTTKKATLSRSMGWQTIDVPTGGQGFAAVELTVSSSYPGKVYKDLCISDVKVLVDSDVAYNAKAERQKKKALLAWKAERLKAAKAFARMPKTWPFAATHFERSVDSEEELSHSHIEGGAPKRRSDFLPLNAQLDKPGAKLAALFTSEELAAVKRVRALFQNDGTSLAKTWHRLEVKEPVLLPDGVSWELADVRDLLDMSRATLFEAGAKAGKSTREGSRKEGWFRNEDRSNARVVFAADKTKVKQLAYYEHEISQERSVYERKKWVLVSFDDDGRLYEAASFAETSSGVIAEHKRFTRASDGKIASVVIKSASYEGDDEMAADFAANTFMKMSLRAVSTVASAAP